MHQTVAPHSCIICGMDDLPTRSFSFGGRCCEDCDEAVIKRAPWIISMWLGVVVFTCIRFGTSSYTAEIALFFLLGIVASAIDLKSYILPDRLVIPMQWIGLISAMTLNSPTDPVSAIKGACVAYLVPAMMNGLIWVVCRQGGAIGQGDMKLAAALGGAIGLTQLPQLLNWIVAFAFIHLVIECVLKGGWGRLRDHAIPLGPSIVMAGSIVILV